MIKNENLIFFLLIIFFQIFGESINGIIVKNIIRFLAIICAILLGAKVNKINLKNFIKEKFMILILIVLFYNVFGLICDYLNIIDFKYKNIFGCIRYCLIGITVLIWEIKKKNSKKNIKSKNNG